MKDEFPIWRIWLTGKATLNELETEWSLDDLVRANTCIEIQTNLETVQMSKVKENFK